MNFKEYLKPLAWVAGIGVVAFLGLRSYSAYQAHQAVVAANDAIQHHHNGVQNAAQGQVQEQQAAETQAKIDAAQKELAGAVAARKAADAKADRLLAELERLRKQQPQGTGQLPGSPVGGDTGIPPIPNTPPLVSDLKDQVISALVANRDALRNENGILRDENTLFKQKCEQLTQSVTFYKAAYSEEKLSHSLDNVAHAAALRAAKARTLKVGILSFGGGAAVGGLVGVLVR